ncbi:MAG TPA: ABC transporter substrate-binding protein [Thermodesulfovibrionales bacterium]|nr:ABC transporter substrate-binding protein [Thermodesulfovibrionales bacterium]
MGNTIYRKSSLLAVSIFLVVAFPLSSFAGEPTDQIKQTIDDVIKVLNNKELKKPANESERKAKIRSIIENRFDFAEMAKRSLGVHWSKRNPNEQKEFVPLFSDLLEDTYVRKIERYEDEKVQYVGESEEGSHAVVKTKIVATSGTEIPVDYKIFKKGNKWEIYDIIIEGVSLVNNYRTQFNHIISSSSYEELVKRLKAKSVKSPG